MFKLTLTDTIKIKFLSCIDSADCRELGGIHLNHSSPYILNRVCCGVKIWQSCMLTKVQFSHCSNMVLVSFILVHSKSYGQSPQSRIVDKSKHRLKMSRNMAKLNMYCLYRPEKVQNFGPKQCPVRTLHVVFLYIKPYSIGVAQFLQISMKKLYIG